MNQSSVRSLSQTFFLLVISFVAGGCGVSVYFTAPNFSTTVATNGWVGPYAADLRSVVPYTTYGCGTAAGSSYQDYVLRSNSSYVALAESVCISGSQSRVLARIYKPYSLGGTGWQSLGVDTAFVDRGGTEISDLALAISPSGNLLTAFWDGLNLAYVQSATYDVTSHWGRFLSSLGIGLPVAELEDVDLDSFGGETKDLAWDSFGYGFLAYHVNGAEAQVVRYEPASGWDASTIVQLSDETDQIRVLNDGVGVTVVWSGENGETGDNRLRTWWSADSNAFSAGCVGSTAVGTCSRTEIGTPRDATTYNTPDVQSFDAAADGNGNVVTVFIQEKPGFIGTCGTLATNCEYRMFSSVRTGGGVWTGPMQIDGERGALTFSLYHDGATHNAGLAFMAPVITYLGNGQFLTVFGGIDSTSTSAPEAHLYSRTYTVGSGWGDLNLLEEIALQANGGVFQQFRPFNHLSLASDGAGSAVLTVREVTAYEMASASSTAALSKKHYGYLIHRYVAGTGWAASRRLSERDHVTCSQRTITAIDDIDGATVQVTTEDAHGLTTGDSITIADSDSTPVIDGTYTVTVLSNTEFKITAAITDAGTEGIFAGTPATCFLYPERDDTQISAGIEDTDFTECPSDVTQCRFLKAGTALFSTGEAVVTVPGPTNDAADFIRLFTLEYRP